MKANKISSFFRKIFGLKASVHTDVPCPEDPNMLPAIVPAAPTPIKSEPARVKSRRPKDPRRGLKYTQFGNVVVIECGGRNGYRAVTRAIDTVCGAQRKGLDHRRNARERKVIVLNKDIPILRMAMGGASYHRLRTAV